MPSLLIVDDEESVRYSFRYVFEADGIDVLTAATGAEGLDLASERDPDVVLLDLHLPDRSGLEVFHELHSRDPKRPVIFVTAHGTTESASAAMKHGAFDYLVKPVDLEHLTEILARAFEAARFMRVPVVVANEEKGDGNFD
jgi:two-component system, NtrC family, nitrogen regulation response regulator GlnG